VAATFNITTSQALTITVDDIIAKVNANDEKIQDIKADITVTSNAPWMASESHLKIWIKGNKQKVEEISPNPGVYIRPVISEVDPSTFMDRTIISYNSANNIYAIKSKANNQTEEYPYEIDYIDYNKGVIIKTEYHLKENNFETIQIKEYSDFIQIGDIWGFQKEVERIYAGGDLLYTTTNIYSNIQINTGMLDSVFE
jgi:outer membrane lipoprotein-sorting protein